MAGSLNKVTLIGNLGKDPEIRITQDGTKVVTLSVATSESWRDRTTEERRERTEWHRVVVFNARLADIAERFLKKGQKIYIEGPLQSRKYVDQKTQEERTVQEIVIRFKGEILMLDRGNEPGEYKTSGNEAMTSMNAIEDEIPY
jgi:single-strand DNA-binding protein